MLLKHNSGVPFSEALGANNLEFSPYPLLLHPQGNMLRCTDEPDAAFRGRHFLRHKSATLIITRSAEYGVLGQDLRCARKIARCASVHSQIFWSAGVHQKFCFEHCDPQQSSPFLRRSNYAIYICIQIKTYYISNEVFY